MVLQLNASRIAWVFGTGVTVLFALHLLGLLLKFGFGFDFVFGFIPMVDFDREGNLPAYFSSFALFFCAASLALIAFVNFRSSVKNGVYWAGLAILFLFVSLDESISIHEQLIQPLRERFHLSGIFYFSWVVPYAIAVLIIALIYLRFLWRLPTPTRNLSFLSAAIFLSGALGCELVGGYYFESVNEKLDLTYAIITTIEELLEMIGVTLFLFTLFDYLQSEGPPIHIRVETSGVPTAADSICRAARRGDGTAGAPSSTAIDRHEYRSEWWQCLRDPASPEPVANPLPQREDALQSYDGTSGG